MKASLPRLIGFYWKSGSWGLWLQTAFFLVLPCGFFLIPQLSVPSNPPLRWDFVMTLQFSILFVAILFPFTLGLRFFLQWEGQEKLSALPMPHAEFLLTRPVSRQQSHRAIRGLYYGILFIGAVPLLLWGLAHPTIPISFYSDSLKLAAYREAFPHAVVLEEAKGHVFLSCPGNAFFLYLLPCWLMLASGLVAHGIALLLRSRKTAQYAIPLVCLLPLAWTRLSSPIQIGTHTLGVDFLYLAFVRHLPAFALGLLALFLLVQWVSARKAARADAV